MSPLFQSLNLRLMLPHQAALRPTGRRQEVGDLEVLDVGDKCKASLTRPELAAGGSPDSGIFVVTRKNH